MSANGSGNPMGDILFTKLYIPPPRGDAVARPQLLERLDQIAPGSLTLLAAPAGYGKTSLLSAWAAKLPKSVAWISLDEGENDLARFLTYLTAAIRTLHSDFGESALVMLRSPKSLNPDPILTGLLNEISDWNEELFLVLDDYHVLSETNIHRAVSYILDHIPSKMQVLIATRTDPPLSLARLRGRGKLQEFRVKDLQFSLEEAKQFIKNSFELQISEKDLQLLNRRTEGWITGLQLAALSLKGLEDPSTFIQAFAGDDRLIVDYLVEEVLSNLPKEKRHFLTRTGILRKLSSSLCDAVVYGDAAAGKSEEFLESIEADNLFLVPMDNRRLWFRYHQLFADLLQKRLMETESDFIPKLHRRASEWFENQGYANDAIRHAYESGDVDRAAELIIREAEATLMRSEVITLRRWIDRLPEGFSYPDPQLYIYHAISLLLGGASQEDVEDVLQGAESDPSQNLIRGEVASLRAMAAMYRGEMNSSVKFAQEALDHLPETSHFLRSLTIDTLGIAYVMQGDLEDAVSILQEAVQAGQDSGNILVAAGALSNVAGLVMHAGDLKQAYDLYSQALEIARDSEGKPLPIAGKALMGLGEIAREQNDLEKATRDLLEAIDLLENFGEGGIIVAYLTLSRIYHVRGDDRAAFEMLEKAQKLATQSAGMEMDDILVSIQRARLNLSLGNLEEAIRWVDERELDSTGIVNGGQPEKLTSSSFTLLELSEYTTWVRILIAQGRYQEAQSVLDLCLSMAQETNQLRRILECQILQAVLHQGMGKMDSAVQIIREALDLANEHGYFRIFLDEGEELVQLLYEASRRGIEPDFAGKLLAAYTHTEALPKGRPLTADALEIVEPLSERELEVLGLIAQGMSNQEIARKLVLSLSTVKWHSGNIYGKLGAKNRTQAVAKARQLGILDVEG
jgi:LuxR family maltose regulon positive regulatory protein